MASIHPFFLFLPILILSLFISKNSVLRQRAVCIVHFLFLLQRQFPFLYETNKYYIRRKIDTRVICF